MIEEVTTAIKQLASNKTPGLNGLTAEFYKVFWCKFGNIFYEPIIDMYNQKKLPLDLKTGVINLLPKPIKHSQFLKNLRPITLLNTDYKIIEKMVANHIEEPMQDLIHPNQTGFMKNRQLANVVRKLLDLM